MLLQYFVIFFFLSQNNLTTTLYLLYVHTLCVLGTYVIWYLKGSDGFLHGILVAF